MEHSGINLSRHKEFKKPKLLRDVLFLNSGPVCVCADAPSPATSFAYFRILSWKC